MTYTKEERRNYQKRRRTRLHEEFFADKVCAQCGGTDRLTLRYTGPAPAPDLSTLWDWKRTTREHTLAQCEVLCVRHQRIAVAAATMARRELPPHGLARAYQHDCHCELCAACRRQYIHLYRSIRYRFKRIGIVIPLRVPDPYAELLWPT